MGKFLRCLAISWIALVGALPLGCLLAGLASAFFGFFLPGSTSATLPDALGGGVVLAIPAVLVGWLPAFAYGAPLYALLASHERANYLTAALVGALPGVLGWDAPAVMGFLALHGIAVACLTHCFVGFWLKGRRRGSGNSSKPTPLRGGA